MMTKTRHGLAAAAFVGSLVALSVSLTTHEVAAQTVLRACYVPNTGVVYRIGLPDTPDECKGKKHVEFSWTDGEGANHGSLAGLANDDHSEYVREGEAAGGDLEGTYPNPTVDGLQGNAVSATAPEDGQVLAWSTTDSEYLPTSLNGAASPWDVLVLATSRRAYFTNFAGTIERIGEIARCPEGHVPINGGYSLGGADIPPEDFAVTMNYPVWNPPLTGARWTAEVTVQNRGTVHRDHVLDVFAICVPVSS